MTRGAPPHQAVVQGSSAEARLSPRLPGSTAYPLFGGLADGLVQHLPGCPHTGRRPIGSGL